MSHTRQRRIRLRVGRGGVLYCMITAIVMFVAVYAQSNLLFWSFGLLIGGLVVSLGMGPLMMGLVEVRRLPPPYGVAGRPMAMGYELTNHRKWLAAFGVVVVESVSLDGLPWRRPHQWFWRRREPICRMGNAWVSQIGPGQTVRVAAPFWPQYRGVLELDKITLVTSFPFSILELAFEFDRPAEVLIHPHLYRLSQRMLRNLQSRDSQGRRTVHDFRGEEEFYGLRDYRPDDSVKLIDWRRSARTGRFVSKEMTQLRRPRTVVVLDLRDRQKSRWRKKQPEIVEPGDNRTVRQQDPCERAISLAASLICEAYHCGMDAGLEVLGVPCESFEPHHSPAHRTKMLGALAQLDLDEQGKTSRPHVNEGVITVKLGHGPPTAQGRVQPVLGAADMEQYVLGSEASSAAMSLWQELEPVGRRGAAS